MPYSKQLAERVRAGLRQERGVTEKRMFGGLGFLLHGNMLAAVWNNDLIVRLGEQGAAEALKLANVRVFDVTGKPMRGWVIAEADGLDRDDQLAAWLDAALEFTTTLPRKST
ncbi:MAG: TfoX/Sxy family protein [Planctomycetaceae bacterium]|nr:TfoX/Sxy family protein [Planctomycetaceae bacterium]